MSRVARFRAVRRFDSGCQGWITAIDLISALGTGTHWDITATDQIRPIATTTAIPIIPVRICIPLCVRALSLAKYGSHIFRRPNMRQFTVDDRKLRHPCGAFNHR